MSAASPDVPGVAQELAGPTPKPILIIGGRGLQKKISSRVVDFCGCDGKSLNKFRKFSDYKIVIYWPDRTVLEQDDADYFIKLQQLMVCTAHGQLVVCVVSSSLASPASPFRWITPSLCIFTAPNNSVQESFKITGLEHTAYRLLREVSNAIDVWWCQFVIMRWKEHLPKKPQHDTWGALRGDPSDRTWNVDHLARTGELLKDCPDQPVTIQAGHFNLTKEIKSIVITANEGGLLLIPEPQSPAKLVDAVRKYLTGSNATKPHTASASDDVFKPSAVKPRLPLCQTCGMFHSPTDFSQIQRHLQLVPFSLNGTQATIIKKLHNALPNWCDLRDLGLEKTPREFFRKSKSGLPAYNDLVAEGTARWRLQSGTVDPSVG